MSRCVLKKMLKVICADWLGPPIMLFIFLVLPAIVLASVFARLPECIQKAFVVVLFVIAILGAAWAAIEKIVAVYRKSKLECHLEGLRDMEDCRGNDA